MAISSGKKQSTVQGIINILLTAVGVGMLTLSASIAEAGWVLGFAMFFVFGLLAILLCILLDRSMVLAGEAAETEITKYEDIGKAAFGPWGFLAASVPLHLSLVGCSCALMALLAEYSRKLLVAEEDERVWLSHKAMVVWWGLFMLPITWLKTMKHVGMVSSTVGVGAVFVMLLSIVAEGFKVFAAKVKEDKLPKYPAWPRDGIKSVGIPFAAFTLAFAVTCTVPTIIRDLEKRQKAKTVVTLGVLLTMVVYFLLTIAGYLAWGDEIESGSILDNMDEKSFFAKLSQGSLILACACHYAVMLHPTCRAVEDLLNVHEVAVKRTVLRSTLVVGTIAVAAFVTNLRIYVGILGAVTFAAIHSFLPPLFYWRLCHLRGVKLSMPSKAALASIMGMTLVGGYFGLKDALSSFN